jgi:hypothetical protein
VSLWKPYQAMAEIWTASRGPRREPGLGLAGAWWTAWVVTSVAAGASVHLYFRAERAAFGPFGDVWGAYRVAAQMDIVSGATDVPAALLALAVVRTVHRLQETHPLDEVFA